MGKKKRSKKPHENDHHTPHSHPSSTPTRKRKRRKPRDPAPAPDRCSGSDCSPPSSPSSAARRLLEPYPKPRLAALLASAASADPALLARVRAAADASLSHRRVFVHGLPPRAADGPALEAAFSAFGPLADCHVVAGRASPGRCKGYGFVTFRSRAAARRAVRAPWVSVAGCPVSVQFASAGPDRSGAAGVGGRRVYVANVAPDASVERLRAFFAGFGELEGGPFGFGLDADGEITETGRPRSRGYALFVYREAEGARKAVQEPYRVFEGRTLRCQLAADSNVDPAARKKKNNEPPVPAPASSAALRPVLDAVVAAGAGDLAMYARNPAQAAVLLGQNPILAAAALSSALASAGIVPTPATAKAGTPIPAAVAGLSSESCVAVAPPPVKPCAGPTGGAGLLGPYKPPTAS